MKNKEISDPPSLSISIVIATLNSMRTLPLCLKKISEQDYPIRLVEILIIDGGSVDSTRETAKKYGARVITVDADKQNAEYNKGMGISHAKNEIILLLDHDNIIPHRGWLKKMVRPFIDNKDVVVVEPLRFQYRKSMTLLDRYFALIGGTDPVVYYLGKNSHLSWAFDKYNLYGKAVDKGDYYLVKYNKKRIPALGGNGAFIRRDILMNEVFKGPDRFIHTDTAAELIRKGFNNFALVNDGIIHLTNNSILPFLKRRKYFVEKYFLQKTDRKYKLYDSKYDFFNLVKYILISVTFLVPLFDATRGYLKKRDIAWFIHPLMCFAFVVIYSILFIKGGYIKNVVFKK